MTLIDLSYADPPAPADLAQRARHQGGRIRRQRTARRTGGTALLVAALAGGAVWLGRPAPPLPAPVTTPSSIAASTTAATATASAPHVTPTVHATGSTDGDPMSAPLTGVAYDLGETSASPPGQWVAYLNSANFWCKGILLADGTIDPVSCSLLVGHDPRVVYAGSGGGLGRESVPTGDVVPATPIDWYAYGVADGEVTGVIANLPSGPAPARVVYLPHLGVTVYWIVTRDYDFIGRIAGTPTMSWRSGLIALTATLTRPSSAPQTCSFLKPTADSCH